MGVFVTAVRPRWSDMDVFGHVNHAQTVTLLEEARIALLLGEATRRGVDGMMNGMVVARLSVDYHMPLVFTGAEVPVEIRVRELRAASFVLDYTVRREADPPGPVVAAAETMMVPYDLQSSRPRRLTDAERDFLSGWQAGSPSA